MGDRIKNLRAAIERVKKIPAVELLRVSSFYETAAWGITNQPDFVNAAIKIRTELEPFALLDELQKIESELGRVRTGHWAARTIDVDILMIDGLKINSERLTVPHKFLYERDFVKIPLAEISPLKFNLHGDRVEKIFGSPTDFNLKLISCVDKNFGIGYKGELLFHIAEDLKNFRRLTINQTVIYGRKTLATLPNGKPLESRRNIIFSRNLEKISGAEIVHSVNDLWEILGNTDSSLNFVIGGGEIFHELLPYAKEIYLTVVDEEKDFDVKFPNFDEDFFLTDSKQEIFCNKPVEFRIYTRVDYAKRD